MAGPPYGGHQWVDNALGISAGYVLSEHGPCAVGSGCSHIGDTAKCPLIGMRATLVTPRLIQSLPKAAAVRRLAPNRGRIEP